ncbi:MAG: carboxypeptidase-like regulatory domain-containing protein [Gemmatimonadota bacterium]|nr:carboxypeptidase-like regulatory domain-containing protein [Gemmatimonadota bacterium]
MAWIAAPLPVGAQAGAATDVIVGRVSDAVTGAPIEQATVSATSIATGRVRSVLTSAEGRYLLVFADGGGRYELRVRRLGYAATTIAVARRAEADRVSADFALSVAAAILDRVVVLGGNRDSTGVGAAGTGRILTQEQVNRLPIDNAGDLAAIAALAPGVVGTPATDTTTATFSVAGQRPTQNHISLDGLSFAAGTVPRDAVRATRVVTSTYDVAKGQFSGGEVASSTRSGTNRTQATIAYDAQSHAFQIGAAPSAAFSREYSLNRVTGSLGGALVKDRLFAFGAVEASERVNPIATLLVSDPLTNSRLGIATDTVTRFLDTVSGLGIPLNPIDIPNEQTQDRGSFLGRIDFVANETNHVTLRGDWSGSRGLGSRGSPRGLLQNLGRNMRHNSGLFAGLTTQIGSVTNDVRATLQVSSRQENGYVELPRGRVFISSATADGAISTYDASIGGNQDFPARSSSQLLEAGDELAWLTRDGAHRVKVGLLVNRGSGRNDVNEEKNGVFFFNSLADLAAGRPASFERVLSASLRSSSRAGAAIYAGDAWQPHSGLEIDYGARFEGSRYGDAPAENSAVLSTFGLSTGAYPSEVHLSPRLGFTYSSRGDKEGDSGLRLRGGFGEFRGVIPDRVFANAAQSTGLASGQTKLTCTGSDVPTPDWRGYLADPATIPTSCVGGTSSNSATLPSVVVFDRQAGAPRTWRSSFGATHRLAGPFTAALDLFYIEGVSQLGIPDLNLRPDPEFTLRNEAARPIYVPASSIDPGTGAVSVNASRLHPEFGQVSVVRSFLRSRTRQATASISGETSSGLGVDASYTYTNSRDQSLGYEGEGPDDNAFLNPNVPAWGRTDEERRHQVEASMAVPVHKGMELAVHGRLVSGFPFSARLATDINGDGQRNDRSFVFDPSAPTTDSVVAAGMRQLVATGTSTARQCLPRQFGRPAERNGCAGPWVFGLDMKLTVTPKVSFARRLTLSVTALNALVGVDELLHGRDGIHGWGQDASVDQRLLFVTGFDPATQSFRYRVNQHFGAASGALNPFRIPFVLSMQARLAWGGSGP